MSLLQKKHPIVINVYLAAVTGVTEAIVLQQIAYWVTNAREAKRNYEDGRYWAYNTIDEWKMQLPCYSANTIRRATDKLEQWGILITGNYNKMKMDRTKWYTIDFKLMDYIEQKIDERLDDIQSFNLSECIEEYNALIHSNNAFGKNAEPFTQNEQINYPKWENGISQNGEMELPIMGKAIPEITTETSTEITTNNKKSMSDKSDCRIDIQPITEAWNSLNLNKLVSVKGKRATMLNARIKEYNLDGVLEAISNIHKSSFLRGQNKDNWVITFDWLIKPNNFIKVLEGNYNDKAKEGNNYGTNGQAGLYVNGGSNATNYGNVSADAPRLGKVLI